MKKTTDRLSWVLAIPFALWFAIPSSVFLQPESINYIGRDATFVREVPFGAVYADWVTEINVIGSDKECTDSGSSFYQVKDNSTVKFTMGEILWPCIDMFGEKVIKNRWTVKLFGIIPLRPYTMTISKLDN